MQEELDSTNPEHQRLIVSNWGLPLNDRCAAVAVATFALLVASCQSRVPLPIGPSASPAVEPSGEASPSVGPTPAAPSGIFERLGDLAEPFDVSNSPDSGAAIQSRLEGTIVSVISPSPISNVPRGVAIRVEYTDPETSEWLFGWLRPEAAAAITLKPSGPCPKADRAHILSALPTEALACFGDESFELSPVYVSELRADKPYRYQGEPGWLADPGRMLAGSSPDGDSGAMPIHFSPESGAGRLPVGWYALKGHFDDARSSTCSRRPTDPSFAVESQAEQTLWCRQQFVVTAARPADPPPD
jgi:hypothetical protein